MPTVRDYMSKQLVYLAEGARPGVAVREMLGRHITTVPVLDEAHVPVGVVALRDIVDKHHEAPHVSEPPKTVAIDAPIEDAARAMIDAGIHHLVVVDDDGKAAGMLSSLDVIRALVGAAPAPH